jgi:hypothetical protein
MNSSRLEVEIYFRWGRGTTLDKNGSRTAAAGGRQHEQREEKKREETERRKKWRAGSNMGESHQLVWCDWVMSPMLVWLLDMWCNGAGPPFTPEQMARLLSHAKSAYVVPHHQVSMCLSLETRQCTWRDSFISRGNRSDVIQKGRLRKKLIKKTKIEKKSTWCVVWHVRSAAGAPPLQETGLLPSAAIRRTVTSIG